MFDREGQAGERQHQHQSDADVRPVRATAGAWPEPGQARKYIECQDGSPVDILGVEIVDQYEERFPAAGLGEQDSAAMTATVTASVAGEEFAATDTFHAYREGDRWYVSLNDETFACSQS